MPDFEEIISSLNSRNIRERIDAVKQLGETGDPRAVEYLINNLPELHSELRLSIIQSLAKLKDPQASGPLIVVYDETPSPVIRREIINALLNICDEHSISKLMEIIKNPDEDLYLRVTILKDIIKFRQNDSSQIINTAVELLKDKKIEIRKTSLILLEEYKVRNIQNYVIPLLKEDDIELRSHAFSYLYNIEGDKLIDRVISILSSDEVDISNKEKIVEVMGEVSTPKVKGLLEKLSRCNIESIRKYSVISLAHFTDSDVAETLSKRLQDKSVKVKKAALISLSKINARSALKFIIPLIMDKDDSIREDAVFAVKELISHEELSKLEPLLNNPNNKVVKSVLQIYADKKFFPDSFFDLVNRLIAIEDSDIRKYVITILSINREKKCYDYLFTLYDKLDEDLKVELLYSLKGFTAYIEKMVPVLFTKYKEEESPKIRSIITDIIAVAGNSESGNILLYIVKNESDSRTKSNAVEALEDYSEILDEVELINTIMPALKDDNNRVKANAAKALWKFGGLRMVAMLEDMLRSEDKWQRASSCFVLGEIGSFQVVPVLKKCIEDQEDVVRANAIKALGKCGEKDLIKDYIEHYNNETKVVKQAIVFSIRYIQGDSVSDFIIEKLEEKNIDIAKEAAYTCKSILKNDPDLIRRIADKIDVYDKEVLKILIDSLAVSEDKYTLELLERLSYYDDIEISSKALKLYKKVEKIVIV